MIHMSVCVCCTFFCLRRLFGSTVLRVGRLGCAHPWRRTMLNPGDAAPGPGLGHGRPWHPFVLLGLVDFDRAHVLASRVAADGIEFAL